MEEMSVTHDVDVLAPRPYTNWVLSFMSKKWKLISQIPPQFSTDRYTVIRPQFLTFPGKIFYSVTGLLYWMGVKRSKNFSDYDVIHVNWLFPDGYIINRLKNLYPRTPIVLTIHGSDWYGDAENERINQIKKQTLFRADQIITVGEKLKQDIAKKYPELEMKIQSVPNGLNFNEISLKKPRGVAPYKKADSTKLLMVGNYVDIKGHVILFRALNNILKNRTYDIELILVGNALDRKYFEYLKTCLRDLSLEQITTVFVSIPRQELYQLYERCDLFILPTLREGFGLSLVEALAHGKPVISTQSGGPEQIVNDTNGILVSPSNETELAQAIETMINNLHEYDASNIRADAYGKYSYSTIANLMTELYRKLIRDLRE